MNALVGINLLRLLSKNQLSDFHTVLESLDPDQIQNNAYIKQAVDLGKLFKNFVASGIMILI
jgi:26S proteasome regulatory subunit N12